MADQRKRLNSSGNHEREERHYSTCDEHAATTVYSHSAQLGLTYAFGDNSQVMPPAGGGAGGSDWYVSVFGGAAFPEDINFDYGTVYAFSGKTGFTIGAAVGTHFAQGAVERGLAVLQLWRRLPHFRLQPEL